MKKLLLPLVAIMLLASCHSGTDADSSMDIAQDSTVRVDSFFPVTSFIKGQFILLDSTPVTPLLLTTINDKTDSVWIKRDSLRSYLQSFVDETISHQRLHDFFKETRFKDLTINSITFTYEPIKSLPDSIKITNWDVYVNPETGKISKIYIVKNWKDNKYTITQQLTWLTEKSAQITTIKEPDAGGKAEIVEKEYKWNFN